MSENTKLDIPEGQRLGVHDETDLVVPDLPGDWEWSSANHASNHKVNIYFGLNEATVGGHLGEIDNWVEDGDEKWTVHVRPIVDDGTPAGIPRGEAETAEEYESLDEAIDAVPSHIEEHYQKN